MIKFITSSQPARTVEAQARVYFFGRQELSEPIHHELTKEYPALDAVLNQHQFKGAAGSSVVIPVPTPHGSVTYLICIGLGNTQDIPCSIETYRRSLGTLVRIIEKYRFSTIALQMPEASCFACDAAYVGRETALTIEIASYHFDRYITDEKKKIHHTYHVTLCVSGSEADYDKGAQEGIRIAHATNQARLWVDTPPSDLHPYVMAQHAESIAKKLGMKATIFSEEQVRAMGMGGLAGVSAGSEQDCQMIILEYRCGDDNAPHIGLVGKGITFDSGGLSLKPAASMESMKEDMSGAAAVICAMDVIGQTKPRVNVTAVVPVAENLPSGKATKPGDILTFYNGKTAEVRNTDAEGRLILADALSYAVKHYKLDALIDLATLTGACAYALGPFFAGMMGKDEALMERVKKAAKTSGDRVWELPFDDDYKAAIQSKVADICNIGSSSIKAGSITAGFFLSYFTDNVPWVHLDIAGVAYDVPDMSYFRPGATGYGVRLLVDLIHEWQRS